MVKEYGFDPNRSIHRKEDKEDVGSAEDKKRRWAKEIRDKVAFVENTLEPINLRFVELKSLLNHFFMGTNDENIRKEISLLFHEVDMIDINSSDFEPSFENLINEIQLFSEEYLKKFEAKEEGSEGIEETL